MIPPLHVLVTGATGYVGGCFCRLAAGGGVRLTILGRREPSDLRPGSYRYIPYALGDTPPAEAFVGVDAVVHLAAASIRNSEDESLDLRASEDLLRAGRCQDVPTFVFVSSQSAREDATTGYGRSKYAIEFLLNRAGECVVRAGLIYGGPEKGLFGVLCSIVRKSPILPVIAADAPIQPVHIRELCDLLLAVARRGRDFPRLVRIGAPEPVPFKTFLLKLARVKAGRRPLLVPVPLRIALLATSIARSLAHGDASFVRLAGVFASRRIRQTEP